MLIWQDIHESGHIEASLGDGRYVYDGRNAYWHWRDINKVPQFQPIYQGDCMDSAMRACSVHFGMTNEADNAIG